MANKRNMTIPMETEDRPIQSLKTPLSLIIIIIEVGMITIMGKILILEPTLKRLRLSIMSKEVGMSMKIMAMILILKQTLRPT